MLFFFLFLIFFLSRAQHGCIYLIKKTVKKILWNYSCDAKLNFQQSSVSHDPSENALICGFAHRTFLIWSIFKTVVLLHIFVENTINFFQDFLMNWKYLLEIEIFC